MPLRKPSWSDLRRWAQGETEQLLAELPRPIRDKVAGLPIVFQEAPGRALVDDGLEPDILGLFVGDDEAHAGTDPLPPEILLFLNNLWDEAEGDMERYRQEVRITLLHEIGHFLGLDETDLFERDLE